MNTFKPSKPQWDVSIKPGMTAKWINVGAGWNTERGGISVRLNEDVAPQEFLRMLGRSIGRFMLFPRDDNHVAHDSNYDANLHKFMQPCEVRTSEDAPPPPHEPDYMERKRAAKAKPPPQPDVDAPTGELEDAPDWL